MAKSVTVNGKKIYSDKNVKSIFGTRITYTDGSWCDVETGEVVNNGQGFISIGTPAGKEDKKETIEKSFKANALTISTLSASVDIQVNSDSDSEIKVKVEGPASIVKDIDISENKNMLYVKGKGGRESDAINIVSGSSSINIGRSTSRGVYMSTGNITISDGCCIAGNIISIGRSRAENETRITISVPKRTSIDVSDISGQVNIGNTEGKLRASVRGGNKINAGQMKDTVLSLQGGGDIRVQEVNGDLTTQLAGSGDIRIKQGNVTTLNATVTGSGDIKFGGKAENAILAVTGSGDIQVAYVKNHPITNIVGSGNIDVDNW